MSSFSTALQNDLLDHVFRNTSYTSPSTVYLALYTSVPNDGGGGTEVSGNGYSRQAITFGAASSGSITNSADVEATASGGNWGDIIAVGIFDAASSGNFLAWDAITSTTINDGDTIRFPSGNITVNYT